MADNEKTSEENKPSRRNESLGTPKWQRELIESQVEICSGRFPDNEEARKNCD